MLALSTFLFRLLCLILQFDTVKEAEEDSLRSWRTPFIQLRGVAGGESCVYLQPVIVGDNVILSPGNSLKGTFQWISWSARSPTGNSTTHYTDWVFLGGLNATRHAHVFKPEKYAIDWRGFLFIRNVSCTQNGTEFKAEVKTENDREPEKSFVELFFIAVKAFPTTTRSGSQTSPTEMTYPPSTGSTKSTADDCKRLASLARGEGIGIGVIVGFVVCMLVVYAFFKCKQQRSGTATITPPEEELS